MSARPSLRLRLVMLTTAAVAVVWLATAYFTWREALHEIEELLDHPPASVEHIAKDRRKLAGEIAEPLLKPMLYALPSLALVLALAVGLALRPLRQLTEDISTRAPDRLTPIDATQAPAEIVPLVQRLNELFAGIDRALDNERRFTADAAHELRTPLAAIKAQAQVAQASGEDAERQRALTQIVVGCDRATHLVEQLLTLARLDALHPGLHALVDLHPLAAEVLAMAAGSAIAGDCELSLDDGDARICGDAVLLQVLLRNLVDNALRHSGAAHIVVGITTADQEARLTIRDDGRGIPAEEREQVLQRFYRPAGTESSGSGLGLSIVQRIAALHGGRIAIEPAGDDKGFAVTIHLPLGETPHA